MVGEVTKEGVKTMQESVDRVHDAFREHVRVARGDKFTEAASGMLNGTDGNYFQMSAGSDKTSIEQVMDQVATGDVFLGSQALKLGLVDRLITSDEYIAEKIRQGSRVLKLVEYRKQSPRLFGGSSILGALKKMGARAKLSLLAWAEDGLVDARTQLYAT